MLSSLSIRQFRIIDRLQLELDQGMTVFVGDNAQGKTSVLEAVCLLLRLSSPRAKQVRQCIRHDCEGFALRGQWQGIEHGFIQRGPKRELYQEQVLVAKSAEYLSSSGLLVWLGSEDLALVRSAAEHRRRYLDFLGAQLLPGYRGAKYGYEKARMHRNRLLKDGVQSSALDAFTGELIRHGKELMQLRASLVKRLQEPALQALTRLGSTHEQLTLRYLPGAEQDFAAHLQARSEAELRRGQTLVGPHRDDVELLLNNCLAADFASEGQQRSIAIALKIAQGRLLEEYAGVQPIWLIDDVFGELDVGRRHAFLQEFSSESQQLVTTTNLHWLEKQEKLETRMISLRNGAI